MQESAQKNVAISVNNVMTLNFEFAQRNDESRMHTQHHQRTVYEKRRVILTKFPFLSAWPLLLSSSSITHPPIHTMPTTTMSRRPTERGIQQFKDEIYIQLNSMARLEGITFVTLRLWLYKIIKWETNGCIWRRLSRSVEYLNSLLKLHIVCTK